MKRFALVMLAWLALMGCASTHAEREWLCRTDMECELEESDDMSWEEYLAELDDLEYFDVTGKVRL